MKKQCGYLDDNKNFHTNIFDCNNANLNIKMRRLRDRIKSLNIYYSRKFSKEIEKGFLEEELNNNDVFKVIEKIFLELLVNQRELLFQYSKEIEILEGEYNNLEMKKGLPKILRKDWWLNEKISFYE